MKVGYIRVSTEEQSTARQEVLMGQLGVEKIYIDKMSGKSKSSFFTEEWQNSNEVVPKNVQLLQRE